MKETFVTTISCMDGRIQMPVNAYMRAKFDVDYVDTVTEAGPNKILAEAKNISLIESIKSRCELSIEKHDSKVIAMVGHYDCGGNEAERDEQIEHIRIACDLVKSWNSEIFVIGLWVNENWEVEELL